MMGLRSDAGRANVLSEAKRDQVVALGRLGWPLRRIEEATGVRRETASGYLKAAITDERVSGSDKNSWSVVRNRIYSDVRRSRITVSGVPRFPSRMMCSASSFASRSFRTNLSGKFSSSRILTRLFHRWG